MLSPSNHGPNNINPNKTLARPPNENPTLAQHYRLKATIRATVLARTSYSAEKAWGGLGLANIL